VCDPRTIALLANPRAGRGRAARERERLEHVLRSRGHQTVRWDAGDARPLDPFDVLCVLGGDGTIHHALADLAQSRAVLYHYPLGTENLIAREFRHRASAPALLGAIDAWQTRTLDLGACEGELFAIMTSVGPDASIIHRVHARRRGRITHASYLFPVLREIARPCLPRIWLRIDGQEVITGHRGVLVVANCRQYGFRLDPAPDARMDDGLLDAVFLPVTGSVEGLGMALACRRRKHLARTGVVHRRGRRVEIATNLEAACWQADGEARGTPTKACGSDPTSTIRCEVRPMCVRVLLPSD